MKKSIERNEEKERKNIRKKGKEERNFQMNHWNH